MGCSSSTSAQHPGGDSDLLNDSKDTRVRFDKRTGKAVVTSDPKQKPESDFFEAVEAGHGEQFMAVRPYLGAIAEPDNHPPHNPSVPDVNYNLEYVYGYRCADSRQNVYFNATGQAVYMTAALGVILDAPTNTQKFFGGGKVENTAKNVANDEQAHTDDITSIAISADRQSAASGQVGNAPSAFFWDAKTGQKKQRFKLSAGSRGVNAISISNCGSLVALVDLHNDHNVYVYDTASGALKMKSKGDTNKIFDICFSAKAGDKSFATAGAKHIKFWNPDT